MNIDIGDFISLISQHAPKEYYWIIEKNEKSYTCYICDKEYPGSMEAPFITLPIIYFIEQSEIIRVSKIFKDFIIYDF